MLVPLLARIQRERPDLLSEIESLVVAGRVAVGGVTIHNVRARVDAYAALVVDSPRELRGTVKLRHALDAFAGELDVAGQTCLDVGASTGGFTTALLARGARKVYALDVGAGQLLGSLRLDARVVNLERTNLADAARHVREPVDVVTLDLSYLSLARALPQLGDVPYAAAGAAGLFLVKPMFELALAQAPLDVDDATVQQALEHACVGAEAAGWGVRSTMLSPVTGARGAVELFVLARRRR